MADRESVSSPSAGPSSASLHVSLVPVLLGRGIPYFADLTDAPHHFADPVVTRGQGTTHLRFRVRREDRQADPPTATGAG
ncbi:hypothetical protein QIS99_31960 [Streptomyces sp. B-S-A8]|uniref:Bacterial bifunctional deaminase-reductase C-terminal domain-containing protein n=1 Tax=Streptomyces solicavernae TaxID=3043614 RepID=A0ABT6S256_9ACTN|nr:hypothetical protein [Streptomyces sp. B-S-A8]MDI3390771.1 hypothetical protein [Streptomyces sp. B-S-A8]